jgi:DNA-binding transcriptional ArsR family regulator
MSSGREGSAGRAEPTWTFLTNHAHALILVAAQPALRVRDLASEIGITERAVQRILGELEEAGYVVKRREGRRNRYEVRSDLPLRHPLEAHQTVRALLSIGQGRGPGPLERSSDAGRRGR